MNRRVLVLVLVLLALASIPGAPLAAQPPSRLSVYAFSRDSDSGFKDELLDLFRRELGKQLESVTELAYDRMAADVSVQLLGQGELTVELDAEGETARYLWRGDDKAERIWALVRVGKFSKEFSLAGSGGRDLGRLAKSIADWIRENSSAIRTVASTPSK
jgi:hypothetical protein